MPEGLSVVDFRNFMVAGIANGASCRVTLFWECWSVWLLFRFSSPLFIPGPQPLGCVAAASCLDALSMPILPLCGALCIPSVTALTITGRHCRVWKPNGFPAAKAPILLHRMLVAAAKRDT